MFAEIRRLQLIPIVDLCHFSVPDWLENFQNEEFPHFFPRYARAFAERFPWVRLSTPINEMSIAARFSALHGWWNERLRSDRAFVTALKHIVRANIGAMQAILEVRPDALFIQSESSEYVHPSRPDLLDKKEPDAERWLWKTWTNIQRLRQDGIPLCGMTWYSLTDQVDWDTAPAEWSADALRRVGLRGLPR